MFQRLKKNYLLFVSIFLILYFFFNLLSGQRGLISYFEKKQILLVLISPYWVLFRLISLISFIKVSYFVLLGLISSFWDLIGFYFALLSSLILSYFALFRLKHRFHFQSYFDLFRLKFQSSFANQGSHQIPQKFAIDLPHRCDQICGLRCSEMATRFWPNSISPQKMNPARPQLGGFLLLKKKTS